VESTRKGEVKNGRLLINGREPSVSWQLTTYTADWCLFDVVQRLALRKDRTRHEFDLIEEFSILRGRQVLLGRGMTTVATTAGEVEAQVFCHFGESVIPTLYYVDTNNRLFLAVSTRRTIVLREEA